jgi:RNA polymerase sigma factor (sigma-70 family)
MPPSADELLTHADWLGRLARALVGDAAAPDLVQDTYEVALAQPPRRDGPLRPWLAGVARNVARMRARGGARRERREHDVAPPAEAPSPDELVERARTQQLVARVVLELDEPFRSTVLYRYYEGMSAADIARAQGVPAGTVRWRLKEALDRVRADLDAHHQGDRRRWAVLVAPLAGAPSPGAATPLVLGGLAVKTLIKITAIAAVLVALVVGSRQLGWWGEAAAPAAAPASAASPPVAAVGGPAARPTTAVHAGGDVAPQFRDDDPRGPLRLEGQVIDDAERPVAGARVAIDANPPIVVTSEGDGSFVFEGLIAREYRIEATKGDGYAGPVRLRLVDHVEPVTLRMREGGQLAVVVSDAVTGAPVAGATVELRSTLTWDANTGADGVAILRGVGPAWAPLHARAAGYAPAAIMLGVTGDPRVPKRVALALTRGAAVSGVVVDEAGAPVAGARVVAAAATEPFPVIDPRRDGVVTGKDGAFRLPAVAAGTHRLTASHPDHGPVTTEPFVIDGVTPRGGLALQLTAGATVRGVVRDRAGSPVAAADVTLVARGHVHWRMRRQAFTGGDGRFTIAGLPRRPVDVVAWHPSGASAIVEVDLAAAREHDLALTLDIAGVIEGVVVDRAGARIADVQVVAAPELGGGVADRAAWDIRGVQDTVSDADGRFRFAGLPDGAYSIRGSSQGSGGVRSSRGAVAARPGDPEVQLVLAPDGGITGQVALADGRSPGAFTVEIARGYPVPFASPDGRFTIDAPAGSHRLVIAGLSFKSKTVADVTVEDGEVADVGTITVDPGRSISGRVLDDRGEPVAGARVAAGGLLTGGGSELYIESESIDAKATETDDDGRFSIEGFGRGAITVVAGKDRVGRSASVQVPAGEGSAVLDLVLAPTGGVFGKVSRSGAPVADTVVIANPIGATSSNFFVATGPDGSFAFDALTAGTYVIYPMIGGGGSQPKDMFVRGVDVVAGGRAEIALDATPGTITLTLTVTSAAGAAPILAAQAVVLQAVVDATTQAELRDGSWIPDEVRRGGTSMMHLRTIMGGAPVEIAGMVPGRYSACVVAMRDPSVEDRDLLPVYCAPVSVKPSPAAQAVELAVP